MVDIIEETAMSSLDRMPAIIADIPKSFANISDAETWSMNSTHSHHFPGTKMTLFMKKSLESQLTSLPDGRLAWIADLAAMRPYWSGWFTNLTTNFLNFPGSRMLVLADTEYMDREMTVAQMQGKFQMIVVRGSGHAIQEDKPAELAEPIANMINKHLKLFEIIRNKVAGK